MIPINVCPSCRMSGFNGEECKHCGLKLTKRSKRDWANIMCNKEVKNETENYF